MGGILHVWNLDSGWPWSRAVAVLGQWLHQGSGCTRTVAVPGQWPCQDRGCAEAVAMPELAARPSYGEGSLRSVTNWDCW